MRTFSRRQCLEVRCPAGHSSGCRSPTPCIGADLPCVLALLAGVITVITCLLMGILFLGELRKCRAPVLTHSGTPAAHMQAAAAAPPCMAFSQLLVCCMQAVIVHSHRCHVVPSTGSVLGVLTRFACCPAEGYLTTQTDNQLVVDTSRGAHIDINVGHAMPHQPHDSVTVHSWHVRPSTVLQQVVMRACLLQPQLQAVCALQPSCSVCPGQHSMGAGNSGNGHLASTA